MRRFLLPLLLALGVTLVAVPQARAGDGPPKPRRDHVAALTEAERTFVEQRIEGWADLPPEKQQRIAQNILRMRSMTDAEKRRLQDHIQRIKRRDAKGERGRGRFHDHATRALIDRALAREARRVLGRDFERTLRRRDISEHAFEKSFGWTFWRKVSERLTATGNPTAPDALPEDFPRRWRQRYTRGYDAWQALPAEAKERRGHARRLHFSLAMLQAERFRARVRAMGLSGEAQLDAVAASLRKEFPQVLEQSLEDPEALVRAAEKLELRRAAGRILRRTEQLEKEEAAVLASLLNRLAAHHRQDEGGAADVAAGDALLRSVLARELRVPAAALADMPPASKPAERLAWLRGLAKRARVPELGGARDAGHGHGRGKGDPRRGRRGPPRLEQPEGVSDADWTIYERARDAALESKDRGALLRLLREKPEGMSDEGFARIQRALKSRMGPRRGR